MTREKFIQITNDTPENLIGDNWETIDLAEWCDDSEYTHEGHLMGGCYDCRMD